MYSFEHCAIFHVFAFYTRSYLSIIRIYAQKIVCRSRIVFFLTDTIMISWMMIVVLPGNTESYQVHRDEQGWHYHDTLEKKTEIRQNVPFQENKPGYYF
jgi:hypothetical protein